MILIRANHDLQTSYLYEYTKPIIKFAEEKGRKFNIIEGPEISEQNLRKRIKSNKPKLIFFNGHGDQDAIYGNKLAVFIDIKSADVFKQTITFTRACDCIKGLGKEAIKRGCFAFIGYKNKFFVARYHGTECKPQKDPIAKPILDASNVVIRELINDKSVEEAILMSHESTAKSIIQLIYSKELWAGASLSALIHNDKSLDFIGNGRIRYTNLN